MGSLMRKLYLASALAVVALSACLSGCDLFKTMEEGEYNFTREGAPSYFYEDFENNDGASSTKNYFWRWGRSDARTPSVSKTWANDGQWSMRIPEDGLMSFTLSAQLAGDLSMETYSINGGSGYWHSDSQADGYQSIAEFHPTGSGATSTSLTLHQGVNNVTIQGVSGTVYLDTLRFTPTLAGASPENGGISTEPPLLDWEEAEGAAPYRLQLSYESDFSSTLLDISGLQESEYYPAGIAAGKCYFWRIMPSKGATEKDWSTPNYFFIADSARNDSFETPIQGSQSLNAWHVGGDTTPSIADGGAYEGSRCLRLDHSETTGSETFAETAVVLSSPRVLRYAYKVVADESADGLPVFLRLTRTSGEGANQYTLASAATSDTEGDWVSAAELIPAGQHLLCWSFSRTADGDSPEGFALIDDIRFEEQPVFTGDDFENETLSGKAWGFQGWRPAAIRQSAGYGLSKGIVIPRQGKATNVQTGASGTLRLIGDMGSDPLILAMKVKGNVDSLFVNRYKAFEANTSEPEEWQNFYYYLTGKADDVFQMWNNSSDTEARIDDVELIPFIDLAKGSLSEGFESGSLGGQYYYNEMYPPILDTTSPHSGNYCLRMPSHATSLGMILGFPIDDGWRSYNVSFWMRSEGTHTQGEEIKMKRLHLDNRFPEIPGEWTKFSFNLESSLYTSWPLTLYASNWKEAGYTVYIDDISIEPR
jgi:hypothetical protein